MFQRLLIGVLSIACLPAAARPAEPNPAAVAHRAWVITETVLERDVAAPSRQEMFLAATQALLQQANVPPPAGLSRRVSQLTTEEQFAALLKDLWPRTGKQAELEAALFQGLLRPAPGARLLTPDEVKIDDQIRNNRYVGTGIQIRMDQKEELTQIVVAFPGGPARKAGAQNGDFIVAVDQKDCHGLSIRDVVNLIRGPEGSDVTLTVRQPGVKEARALKMTRSVVPFENVVGRRHVEEETWDFHAEPGSAVAYVRLSSISVSTLQELRRIEARLRQDGFQALVLDVRQCRSGDVHHVTLIADGLLGGGVMWKERDPIGRVRERRADPDCLFRGWPMAVLVNGEVNTAPSLLAAALQDNRRAVVVGWPVVCEGFVSSLVSLPEGLGALQLRTASLERAAPAKGRTLERELPERQSGWIVEPDQRVTLERKQNQQLAEWSGRNEHGTVHADQKPPEDPQLTKALEVLRAALKKKEAAGS
jgi:carboxyl-terminal processing protease